MFRNWLWVILGCLCLPLAAAAQTPDGITATPTETYNEIKQALTSYACLNSDPVGVGYHHPFLQLVYRKNCDPENPSQDQQINLTLISEADETVCANGSCGIQFSCVDICNFISVEDGIRAKESSGQIWLKINQREAHRIARAMQHFGQLYGATQRPKDKFD